MTKKHFKTAPLPFLGQKRRFIKEINSLLPSYPENTIFIDLFGGSGLLSHNIKYQLPNAKVVYNDYDNYSHRISKITETNNLIAEIRAVTKELPADKKIDNAIKLQILDVVKMHEEKYGYVDYLTLSSSLLFSMNYVSDFEKLQKQTFYNSVKSNSYSADGYLDGIEVVCCDYRELYNQYKNLDNVVFLVDPPYLATVTTGYKDNYWSMKDYLDVLDVLEGTNFVYFTSNKSEIIELCEWLDNHKGFSNPFKNAKTTTTDVRLNHSSAYTDIMISN